MEPHHGPQAGKSGYPPSQNAGIDLLDAHELCHGYRKSLDAFSQILGSQHGLIKGLITGKFYSNGKDRANLDEWSRSPAIDQLEELSFNDEHMRSLPTSALHLTKFMNCHPPLITRPLFFYHD